MDISSNGGGDNSEVTSSGDQLLAVDEVGNHLANALHIEQQPYSNSDAQKLFNKCSSLPCPERNQEALSDPNQHSYARSLSLPSALNLVSAMKGGREKHGLSQKKLSVTWAEDVYDPTPTSTSHTVNGSSSRGGGRKHHKSRSGKKTNAKKSHKGSSSSSSSSSSRGRDGKKHSSRKSSSSSGGRYNRSMGALVSLTDPSDRDFADITVGTQDPSTSYCGSSFLKKSLSSMHYPVAEAL